MTVFYVSSIAGNDNNAGTSSTTAFASLQAAESHVRPGDSVEIMNGTYSNFGNDVLTITTSGTASAPITFEAAPGATPVIDSSGAWQAIEIEANYITVKGLTVVGDAANYNLQTATAGYSTGNANLDGNGIMVNANSQTTLHHHIIIENNTVYNEPGAGIAAIGADYVQILNNNVHDNAHWDAFGASGISIYQSLNLDSGSGPHMLITGNSSVNNAELVPEYRAMKITDGEGIILDTNTGYTGGFLVQNNTTSQNSGPGIEVLGSNNATIDSNTTTGDLTYPNLVWQGEIFNNFGDNSNLVITNNVTTVTPPPPPPGGVVSNGSFETHDFAGWTLGGNYQMLSSGPQVYITNSPGPYNNAPAAEDGTYSLVLGSVNTDATISQTLSSKPGESYTVSFWLDNAGAGNNDFSAKWDGTTLMSLVNAPTQGYTHYTYQVTGTGSDTLQFSAYNNPVVWYLDNVAVTDNGSGGPPPPPPAPVISAFSPNTGGVDTTNSITLTGTALDGTVTVLDGTATVGTAAVTSGAWTITENNAVNGTHNFTATDTDTNGTSTPSSTFPVTVNVSSPPPSNLVANPGFETGDLSSWTLGGYSSGQIYTVSASHSGQFAAGMGSVGSDGSISQNLTTVAGQNYTLDFWLANAGGPTNDFTAKIGGTSEMHLVNEQALGYEHYIFNFTATSTSTHLEFDARQDPSEWHLDDVSVQTGTATRGLAVIGTTGNNILTSPTGSTSDLFTGNGGTDTFVFHGSAFGNATITDFRLGSGHDIAQFDKTVFANFAAVQSHAAQVGSNTVITVDANDSVTLVGTSLSHLQSADFHFV